MKIFIGPLERKAQRLEIESKLRDIRIFAYIMGIAVPLAIVGLAIWIGGTSVPEKGKYSAVAKIEGVGSCSAFLVSEKHLITAAHCLEFMEEGDYLNLTFEGNSKEYKAKIIYRPSAYDKLQGDEQLKKDYAILELDSITFPNYYSLQLNSNSTKLTDPILVAGYPGGVTFSVAKGTVTGLSWRKHSETLQIMAGAWPGNSGGPVIDAITKNVIGILNGTDSEMQGMLISLKTDVLEKDIELAKRVGLTFE